MEIPSPTVTRLSRVISSETGRSGSFWNLRSRFVRIPSSFPAESMTGTPEILYRTMFSITSRIRSSGPAVMGSTIMPDSERLTLSTSRASASMLRLR